MLPTLERAPAASTGSIFEDIVLAAASGAASRVAAAMARGGTGARADDLAARLAVDFAACMVLFERDRSAPVASSAVTVAKRALWELAKLLVTRAALGVPTTAVERLRAAATG